MLFTPPTNEFLWQLQTANVRPAAAMGTAVTPAQNSKGSYAELIDGALVTEDVWFIVININSGATSAATRNILIDIGIDPTAGTSYSVIIPDLLGTSAAPYNVNGGGIWYQFPLHIPAGASIAARASVNNATVGTVRVQAFLYGKPKHPELCKKGHVVEALGVVAATSQGTAVTSGTTSEGSWTSLGSPARDAWWFQLGMGMDDTTMAANVYHAELGAGATQRVIVKDVPIIGTTAEQLCMLPHFGVAEVPESETIYGRLQCSGTVDTTLSMIAYALS